MFRFSIHKKIKILIIFFFLTFFNNSYAETVSTDVGTLTTKKTMNEDLTVTSSGYITCDTDGCVTLNQAGLTVHNSGTIKTIGTNQNNTIVSSKDDSNVFNYGTISNTSSNTAIRWQGLSDSDGDGLSGYIYNSGTIETTNAAYTIRILTSGSAYKIDNYGLITNTHSNGQTIYLTDTTGVTINNYSGGIISATANTDSGEKGAITAHLTNTSSNTTINNWGTVTAAHDTIVLGDTSTINNYGKIESVNFSDSPAIIMKGDNSTVNLYDGTLLLGWIDDGTDVSASDAKSGSTLNIDLCSSYYFKVVGTWTVNDNSECGNLVYSGGFAQSVSPLFQSVADEIGVLRTDLINDVYDFAKDKMENDESFGLPLKSYTKRERGKSINKFASNANGFAFGFPSENDKIKGHLVFNFLKNNIDLLNQNIKDETYQVGFFLENLNAKVVFGYHDYNGDRTRLNNTVSGGKETIKQDHKSFSSIIGTQFSKKLNNNSYIKYKLDSNIEGFFNHEESDHVKWQSRILGQVMGDVTYGWSTLPKNKFKFNPELTLGYRTIIDGKNQKYTFNGNKKNFDGGVKEDFNAKLALQTNYSFNENTNLFFNTSAKKTNSKQETYSLNIGFKSIF